jgi:anti-sigma B factor antagonist
MSKMDAVDTPDQSLTIAPPEPFGPFSLEEEPLEPAGLVLTVSGELDMATTPELRSTLMAAVQSGTGGIVLDLRPVAFLDSLALAAILHARRKLGNRRRMGIVIARDSYTRLIFEVAGLPECLDLFETRDEAVAHVTG